MAVPKACYCDLATHLTIRCPNPLLCWAMACVPHSACSALLINRALAYEYIRLKYFLTRCLHTVLPMLPINSTAALCAAEYRELRRWVLL
jgi:hypothetical protein